MPKAYHTYSLFTITYYLKIKSPMGITQGRQKLTRYHLDSQGISPPQSSVTGRTRNRLPIDGSTPRPCSSLRVRVPSHLPGLSDRAPKNTLLFTAFSYTQNIIAQKQPLCQHLSGNKWAFIVLSKDRCHCEEPQKGDVAIPSKGPRRTIKW